MYKETGEGACTEIKKEARELAFARPKMSNLAKTSKYSNVQRIEGNHTLKNKGRYNLIKNVKSGQHGSVVED